jgi:hypothetical protein
MANQTFIFVALPNGITAGKTLRLSLYLTPRLDHGATLETFPDVLQWPQLIQTSGLNFELRCAGKTTTVTADPAALRPDIWQQIFKKTTYVEPFRIPDFDQRLIVSYPTREAASFFKYAYQTVGSGNLFKRGNEGGIVDLLRDLSFRDGSKSTLTGEISEMRLHMWKEQREQVLGSGTVMNPAMPAHVPPDGVPTMLTPPANVHDTMTRFAMFHNMPPAPNRPPLPQTEGDFAKTLDFHRALTALNSYPSVMRALGLVFDVEVPESFCPASPTATAYRTIEVRKVTPGFAWKLAPKFVFPSTSYTRDKSSFRTAPATAAGNLAGGTYLPGDIVDGYLALTPNNFHLSQVDLDGGLLKALTLADNAQNARDKSVVGDTLPSLRSSGIGLMADGRGVQLLHSIADNKSFDQALKSNTALPRALNAQDLMRGFRIDIWSSSTQEWRSLHRRNATYEFGPQANITLTYSDEEGFLQPTAAQPAADPTRKPDPVATANNIPQPGTDLYVHERVARWDGWSLSSFRPGLALNRSPDPAMATTSDPSVNQPMTPFKMATSFTVMPGSLPELRFGTKYRVRARAVDVAGNSIPLNSTTPARLAAPANGATFPYLRFEPISPPLLVLQQPTQPGATLERMVIRSFNSNPLLDTMATADTDHRHVAPPRVAARLAEHHGMFDDNNGKLRGDASTFHLMVARDNSELPKQGDVPLDPSPLLAVGYLPDPIARGAALRNLPNTPDNTNGAIDNNALSYKVLLDVQSRPGSVTYIDFGNQWPQRSAFLLSLEEGKAKPEWNAAGRELTVSLPKGTVASVDLSSYLSGSDLASMGVWNWLREYFEAQEIAAMQSGVADYFLGASSDLIALLTRLVLEGGHEMITPARTLIMVHAVQQPLSKPQFVQLPVVHRPTDPIFASALRNSFTPITAWRSHGSHSAVLLGALEINGSSSSRIDLQARWLEYSDDLSQPGPKKTWNSAHVETIHLADTTPGPLYADATQTRMVAVYVPKVDALWFSAPIDELAGVMTPSDVAAPVHRFQDSRHRWVGYTAVATSRFEEYFPAGLDFTRSSEPLLVDVPSSARPLAPDIAYIVPTFGWEQQETTNVKSSVRFGNGLRVYLNRPWYSSGDSELLGVVLWNGPAPDYTTREAYKPYFTQWGNDPIWKTGYLADVPAVGNFIGTLTTATQLQLEETPKQFDVAGYLVEFDSQRGLWFCDIELENSLSYTPFIRLALARYQPHSVQGVELSRVVLADYAQLSPDRSAVVSIDPSDIRHAQVFIGGLAPQGPAQSAIEVTVERRLAHAVSDVAWAVAPTSVVTVTENAPDASEPDAVLWSGKITFAKTPPAGQFRVVVREFERIRIDPATPGEVTYGERLVYAAIVNYDYPSGN